MYWNDEPKICKFVSRIIGYSFQKTYLKTPETTETSDSEIANRVIMEI